MNGFWYMGLGKLHNANYWAELTRCILKMSSGRKPTENQHDIVLGWHSQVAFSKRSDSGERCRVKKAMKSIVSLLLLPRFYFFALLFTSHRSPLSERLEQANSQVSEASQKRDRLWGTSRIQRTPAVSSFIVLNSSSKFFVFSLLTKTFIRRK